MLPSHSPTIIISACACAARPGAPRCCCGAHLLIYDIPKKKRPCARRLSNACDNSNISVDGETRRINYITFLTWSDTGGAEVDLCSMAPANAWSTSFLPAAAVEKSSAPPPSQPPPPTLPGSVPVAPPTRKAAAAAAALLAAAAAAAASSPGEEEEGCCCCCLFSTSNPGERDRPLGSPPFEEAAMAALLPNAALTI